LLVGRVRGGDERAWEELIARFEGRPSACSGSPAGATAAAGALDAAADEEGPATADCAAAVPADSREVSARALKEAPGAGLAVVSPGGIAGAATPVSAAAATIKVINIIVRMTVRTTDNATRPFSTTTISGRPTGDSGANVSGVTRT